MVHSKLAAEPMRMTSRGGGLITHASRWKVPGLCPCLKTVIGLRCACWATDRLMELIEKNRCGSSTRITVFRVRRKLLRL